MVNGVSAPWLLGAIVVLTLLTIFKAVSAWRESKRSPYFFLRQQAQRRLQTYLLAVVGLVVIGGATMAFAWQSPPDTVSRMALITKAKPVAAAETESELPVLSFEEPADSFERNTLDPEVRDTIPISGSVDFAAELGLGPDLSLTPDLPTEFDQFEPTEELSPDTEFTSLVFSTEIDDDYKAVAPRRSFGEGFITVYATFDYEGMADGMEWAWIWRRNGEIVNGGNELWEYGDDGPGWIYYEPPEGFQPGEYTLEVWVNGELFQRSSMTIESEVANQ